MIKIAIDAMGSDLGSKIAIDAINKFLSENNDVEFFVFGNEEELKPLNNVERVTIIPTTEVMGMEDGALEVMRKKDTSMMKAIDAHAQGHVDAVVSAGSTGAFLTGATIKLKLIEGVSRAALVSPFPTENGKNVTVLDIGANNENQPEHLVQFAHMGKVYAQIMNKIDNPRVYLLSNGAEEKKGSPIVKEAHKLLKEEKKINFIGNIEARYALSGDADVLVADGYSGNVLLKGIEGTAGMMNNLIKKAFKRNLITKIGYLFASKGFKHMKDTMNYKKYGGAMLLGINGVAIKAHGSSDDYAFYNAIRVAYTLAKEDMVTKIRGEMKNG